MSITIQNREGRKFWYVAIFIAIIAVMLINCWYNLLFGSYIILPNHIIALFAFLPMPILLLGFRFRFLLLYVIGYLVAGTLGLFSATVSIQKASIFLFGLPIKNFNPVTLGLLIGYLLLNANTLADLADERKERKENVTEMQDE